MVTPSARNTSTASALRARGFTILELMIVVAIVGVLASLAFPAFGELIKNSRRTTVVNELSASLMLARAEAAKRGQPVSVCGLTSGGGTSCAGGTNWDYGWMVFLDPDGDGAFDTGEEVMRRYIVEYPDIKVRTNTESGAGPGHFTQRSFNQNSTTGDITICDKRGATRSRQIEVARSGRASVRLNNSEDTTNGAALTCP